jgi:hypothetical protein
MYYRARYFNGEAVALSPDSRDIGDGLSRYGALHDRPPNATDPSGLATIETSGALTSGILTSLRRTQTGAAVVNSIETLAAAAGSGIWIWDATSTSDREMVRAELSNAFSENDVNAVINAGGVFGITYPRPECLLAETTWNARQMSLGTVLFPGTFLLSAEDVTMEEILAHELSHATFVFQSMGTMQRFDVKRFLAAIRASAPTACAVWGQVHTQLTGQTWRHQATCETAHWSLLL